ncbi:hypothetical protein J2S43_002686 [Catenuloplanes nepalensis]|uniref:Uncharacterized protein n=1 Tax=Catenuloplanes nepalensis TaxID=587533 RepID=A0ABT9MRW2_9ACTN|nr:hypothetical protein [Catenuloplanes nepalensis]MDP9794174.1 hypothetical protein [Catenuloplanes nepalensis]
MARHVEIHVPLRPGASGEPPAWIDRIEEFLYELDEQGVIEVFDDGEEWGEVYIFFIAGAAEGRLIDVATRVATLDGVPAGVFARVTDDRAADFGMGRRVELRR